MASRGNIVIGGGQEGGWDLSVDGISATPGAPFEQRLWTTLNSPSVEAITEFAVDTNGFKAEFGHAGGGAVSFVSRSAQPLPRQGVRVLAGRRLRRHNSSARRWDGPSRSVAARLRRCVRRPREDPEVYQGRDRMFFFASYEAIATRRRRRRRPSPSRWRRCTTATSRNGATPAAG